MVRGEDTCEHLDEPLVPRLRRLEEAFGRRVGETTHGAAHALLDGRPDLVRIAQARLSGLARRPAVHVCPQATYRSGRRPAGQPALVTSQLSVDDLVRTDEVLGDPFAPGIPDPSHVVEVDEPEEDTVPRLASVAPESVGVMKGASSTSSDDVPQEFDRMSEEDLLRGLEGLVPPAESDDEEA